MIFVICFLSLPQKKDHSFSFALKWPNIALLLSDLVNCQSHGDVRKHRTPQSPEGDSNTLKMYSETWTSSISFLIGIIRIPHSNFLVSLMIWMLQSARICRTEAITAAGKMLTCTLWSSSARQRIVTRSPRDYNRELAANRNVPLEGNWRSVSSLGQCLSAAAPNTWLVVSHCQGDFLYIITAVVTHLMRLRLASDGMAEDTSVAEAASCFPISVLPFFHRKRHISGGHMCSCWKGSMYFFSSYSFLFSGMLMK